MFIKKSLIMTSILTSSFVWADLGGNYECKTVQNDKMRKQQIHILEKDGYLSYSMTSPDNHKEGELTSTHLPNRFINKFQNKGKGRVGISAWVFQNKHLTIDKILYDVNNPNAFKERVDCQLIK